MPVGVKKLPTLVPWSLSFDVPPTPTPGSNAPLVEPCTPVLLTNPAGGTTSTMYLPAVKFVNR